MNNLIMESTKYTPEINFDCEKNILEIKGKSYPENTSLFYEPVFSWLNEYFEKIEDRHVEVNLNLILINSSSAKVFMDFCDLLDEAAGNGKDITLNWFYEEDDEDGLEMGEEFMEDIESLKFNLVEQVM
ncbi:DUF1987 domain-containing protein [Desulfobacterales bacterium HSG17]|nr:DUF1987 domain-containing protein [Desulfobacterales bacterium HSG17]